MIKVIFANYKKYGIMIWKKVKKLIIPLIIVKFIVFIIFFYRTEMITISHGVTYNNDNQSEYGLDSIDHKRQKLIRIVRNEGERGISIVLRGKKNNTNHRAKEEKITVPLID